MKIAVITGGSGGIGRAAALKFSQNGYRVYELSRSGKDGDNIIHIKADVSDKAQVEEAFRIISEKETQLDLLLNNAGYGISGAVEFTEEKDAEKIFSVNFFGGLWCTQSALPLLREGHGKIINMSSPAAVFAIPFQAFYSASKAAVNLFTMALANEVRPFGISVCAVMPGDTKTGFTASRDKSELGNALYGGSISSSVSVMEKDEQNGMTPEKIANALFKIAKKKRLRPLFTVGASYKLFLFLSKLLPSSLANRAVGLLYRK